MVNCENHKFRGAVDQCEICRKPFCRDCLVELNYKKYCKECLKEVVKRDSLREKNNPATSGANNQAGTSEGGSWGVFIFLVIAGIIVIRFLDEIKDFFQDLLK